MKKISLYTREILFVTLALAAVPMMQASSAATEQLLTKARSLEGRGRLDLAALAWEQTLLADPNNADALLGLAKFAKQNGKIEEANRYLERLRSVDPKNPSISRVEGMASAGRQRSGLEEASRLAGNQNFEGAMRIYRRLYGNEPPPGGLAISYYETEAATPRGWEDAVAGIERLANKYPQSEEYRLSLGRLKTYRQPSRLQGMQILEGVKGDAVLVSKARLAWRQALVWSAGSPVSLASLRDYLSRYPDPDLEKLIAHSPKTTDSKATEAMQRPPAPLDSVESGLGYSSLKSERIGESEQHFQAALKTVPHSSSALAGLGFVRMKQEDFHGAAELFEQALSVQPKNKNVIDALATARFWEQMKAGGNAMNQSHPDTATAYFKQAVALRPASQQATESLAGAYMQNRQPAQALPLYQRLTRLKPQDLEYWYGLVKSQYQSGNAADALAALKQAPTQVKEQWGKNPEHLALLSFIYADAGEPEQSKQMFQRAITTASSNKGELPVDLQLEFAGLLLRMGRNRQAADAFEQVAAKHPPNVDAWAGSINALLQVPDLAHAYDVLQRMPQKAYAVAVTKAEFLRSVARLQAAMKRYDLAEKSLSQAAEIEGAQGRQPDLEGQLQLAELYVQTQKTAQAEKLLRTITEEHPSDKRGWSSLIALLHGANSDPAALAEIQRMPEKAAAEAQADGSFVALQASVYSGAGRKEEALSLVRSAQKTSELQGRVAPVALDVQLAWLLLNDHGSQAELYRILQRDSNRSDLTAAERSNLDQIWSVWSQRRAEAAIASNDFPKAISILEAAAALLPRDARIQASLASTFLRAKDFPKAFDAYQKWNMKGAEPDDILGAVGAASAVHKDEFAVKWLDRGIKQYPNDPRLLRLAGEKAAQHGEYKLADLYFREALAQLPPEGSPSTEEPLDAQPATSRQRPRQSEHTLGNLLVGSSETVGSSEGVGSLGSGPSVSTGATRSSSFSLLPTTDNPAEPTPHVRRSEPASPKLSDDVSRTFSSSEGELEPRTMLSQTKRHARSVPTVRVSNPPYPSVLDADAGDNGKPDAASAYSRAFASGTETTAEPIGPDPIQPLEARLVAPKANVQPTLQEQIQGDLETISGRNTPFLQNGVNLRDRTGEGGFDKLLIEEADLEASTTIADRLRVSLVAKPTYLDSGSPTGSSHRGFGTASIDGISGARTAYGIAGEAQLATRDFGLRVGLTPEQFLVHSWMGGLRWNPAGGPVTILLDRDSVRDTKLSFAGERDPNSRQVWGGVMANGASVIGNWSQGKTGYYASLGYQDLEGKTVATNSRIDANAGSYFKVYGSKAGELTVGFNLTGMHYAKNLRYFTLGQGGYFSPQQYFLVNVPVHWTGNWNRQLQYSVSASLGVQHFAEDSSSYFPTDAARQAASGLSYSAYTNTGGNYNLGFQTIYQITPQWLGGAFFNVNNAREYRSINAGLYLKYLFRPRPLSSDFSLPSIPDWKGAAPLGLTEK